MRGIGSMLLFCVSCVWIFLSIQKYLDVHMVRLISTTGRSRFGNNRTNRKQVWLLHQSTMAPGFHMTDGSYASVPEAQGLDSNEPSALPGETARESRRNARWAMMVRFSGDAARKSAIEAAWAGRVQGANITGFVAYGDFSDSRVSSCNAQSLGTRQNETTNALFQTIRCYPFVEFIFIMDDDQADMIKQVSLEDIEAFMMNSGETFDFLEIQGKGFALSRRAVDQLLLEQGCRSPSSLRECLLLQKSFAGITLQYQQLVASSNLKEVPDLCVVLTFNNEKLKSDPKKSWVLANTASVYAALGPRVKAFLAEPAHENWPLGVVGPPDTNSFCTPVLISLLERAFEACPMSPFLAYANSDILFDANLLHTLDALLAWNQSEMLGIGRRSNHELQGLIGLLDLVHLPSDLFVECAQVLMLKS